MEQSRTNYLIPIAIIVAGALIAGAMFYTNKNKGPSVAGTQTEQNLHLEENMPAVNAGDHILGNPNAAVVMVEYSDTDCPYCQSFQPTLRRMVEEYGKDGKVAWVYRHFAFHPNAPKEAEATECAAELGGNEKFWQYLDLLFSKKDFNVQPYKGLDPSQLPILAESIGLNKTAFTTCLNSGKYATKIAQQYDEAVKSGAQGTPYTILVTRNGRLPITSGAITYDQLRGAVDTLINPKAE